MVRHTEVVSGTRCALSPPPKHVYARPKPGAIPVRSEAGCTPGTFLGSTLPRLRARARGGFLIVRAPADYTSSFGDLTGALGNFRFERPRYRGDRLVILSLYV